MRFPPIFDTVEEYVDFLKLRHKLAREVALYGIQTFAYVSPIDYYYYILFLRNPKLLIDYFEAMKNRRIPFLISKPEVPIHLVRRIVGKHEETIGNYVLVEEPEYQGHKITIHNPPDLIRYFIARSLVMYNRKAFPYGVSKIREPVEYRKEYVIAERYFDRYILEEDDTLLISREMNTIYALSMLLYDYQDGVDTRELAFLSGYILGDGSYMIQKHTRAIRITMEVETKDLDEFARKFSKYLREYWYHEAKYSVAYLSNKYVYIVQPVVMMLLFLLHPEHFLAGYILADGTLRIKDRGIYGELTLSYRLSHNEDVNYVRNILTTSTITVLKTIMEFKGFRENEHYKIRFRERKIDEQPSHHYIIYFRKQFVVHIVESTHGYDFMKFKRIREFLAQHEFT